MYYVLKETELYAPFVQKLKRVYYIFFGNAPIEKKRFSLINVFENGGLNMQYINAPNIILSSMGHFDFKVLFIQMQMFG